MKQSSAANSSSEAVGSLAAMKPVNSLPKPNPSVSNKGLVIVQVENDRQDDSNPGKLLPVYDSVLKSNVQQTYSTISTLPYTSQEFIGSHPTRPPTISLSDDISPATMVNPSSCSPIMINQSGLTTLPTQLMIGQNSVSPLPLVLSPAQQQQGGGVDGAHFSATNISHAQFMQSIHSNQVITLTSPLGTSTGLVACTSPNGHMTTLENCQIISVTSASPLHEDSVGNGMNQSPRLLTLSGTPLQVHQSQLNIHPENLSLKGIQAANVTMAGNCQPAAGGVPATVMAKEDILASATHQLIHGYPPLLLEDEEEDVDEEYEDGEFIPEDHDEGYRTNSSTGGSPSSSIHSPDPATPNTTSRHVLQRGQTVPGSGQHIVTQGNGGLQGVVVGGPDGVGEDEGGNLMWLVDFKLDFFNDIEKTNEKELPMRPVQLVQPSQQQQLATTTTTTTTVLQQPPPTAIHQQRPENLAMQHQTAALTLSIDTDSSNNPPPSQCMIPQAKPDNMPAAAANTLLTVVGGGGGGVTTMLGNQAAVSNAAVAPTVISSPMQREEMGERSEAKPNYTYTDLITLALKDKEALTVSGIYQWISEKFPYFKAEDDRWKNSVRHNLSMNPHFRKGNKSKQGAGHVWVLADDGIDCLQPGEPLKLITNEDEASEAVRNILNRTEADLNRQSAAKQQAKNKSGNGANRTQQQQLDSDSLQKSAEEILAGLKRPTAVEPVLSSGTKRPPHLENIMASGIKRASSAIHLKGITSEYEPSAKKMHTSPQQAQLVNYEDATRVLHLSSLPLNLTSSMPLHVGSTCSLTQVTASQLNSAPVTPTTLCGGVTISAPLAASPSPLSLISSAPLQLTSTPTNLNLMQSITHSNSPGPVQQVAGHSLQVSVDELHHHQPQPQQQQHHAGVDGLQYHHHQVDQHGNPVYAQLEQIGEGVYHYADYSLDYSDADNLERALGIDFQGVVQRELSAKAFCTDSTLPTARAFA